MGQTVAATEEEHPSPLSKPTHKLLSAASKSYIPRPMTRKGGKMLFRLLLCVVQLYMQMDCVNCNVHLYYP